MKKWASVLNSIRCTSSSFTGYFMKIPKNNLTFCVRQHVRCLSTESPALNPVEPQNSILSKELIDLHHKLAKASNLQQFDELVSQIQNNKCYTPNFVTYMYMIHKYLDFDDFDNAYKTFLEFFEKFPNNEMFSLYTYERMVEHFIKRGKLNECYDFIVFCEEHTALKPHYKLYAMLLNADAPAVLAKKIYKRIGKNKKEFFKFAKMVEEYAVNQKRKPERAADPLGFTIALPLDPETGEIDFENAEATITTTEDLENMDDDELAARCKEFPELEKLFPPSFDRLLDEIDDEFDGFDELKYGKEYEEGEGPEK